MEFAKRPKKQRSFIATALVTCVAYAGLFASLRQYFRLKEQSELVALLEQMHSTDAALLSRWHERARREGATSSVSSDSPFDSQKRVDGTPYHEFAERTCENERVNILLWAVAWAISMLLLVTSAATPRRTQVDDAVDHAE